MLLETRVVIAARQEAARRWQEAYNKSIKEDQPTGKAERALLVIVLDHRTSDYLAEFDPMALKHAQEALSGKSWENYKDPIFALASESDADLAS